MKVRMVVRDLDGVCLSKEEDLQWGWTLEGFLLNRIECGGVYTSHLRNAWIPLHRVVIIETAESFASLEPADKKEKTQ